MSPKEDKKRSTSYRIYEEISDRKKKFQSANEQSEEDIHHINEEMKKAAAEAIKDLAKLPVPQEVLDAYGLYHLEFGRDYIIPKPLDARLLTNVTPFITKAAIDSGVARI